MNAPLFPRRARRLTYEVGAEQGPSAPAGAYALTADLTAGTAAVERRRFGTRDRWDVAVSPAWCAGVGRALASSPFPASDYGRRAPDSTWRVVTSGRKQCTVEWRVGIDDPRWAPLFDLLDGLLWLVCPDHQAGTRPDGLDETWLR